MENNYERSRLKARRTREKKKLLIMILIPVILLIAITVTVILIFLSKRTFDTDESAVYLKKNGEVMCASIETLDKDYYKSSELENFVNEQIFDFNAQSKSDVKLTSFKEEDKKIRVFMKYENAKDYERFNGQEFFMGTLSEAQKAGYKIPKNAPTGSDLKVLVMEEKIGVKVDGEIVYFSENMKKVDSETVSFNKSKKNEAQLIWVIYK